MSRFLNVTDVDNDGVKMKLNLNLKEKEKPENQTVNSGLCSRCCAPVAPSCQCDVIFTAGSQ